MGGAMLSGTLLLAMACGGHMRPLPPLESTEPYRIEAGDTLDIVVWREAQLSGPLAVRADGMITLPLLGDMKASGMTPEELSESIRQGLVRFVDSPNVVVRVAASSRRYFIIGNVSSPGMYELRPNQTYLQAIAIAGGFSQFASRGSVRIIRNGQDPLFPDYSDIVAGEESDVLLQNNDTIVVP